MKIHPAEIMIQHMTLAKVLEMMVFAHDQPVTDRSPEPVDPCSKTMPSRRDVRLGVQQEGPIGHHQQ